jgi:SNF2 family DNA or RNA helicase
VLTNGAFKQGTGKTIQTIAFIAHLRAEYQIYGPHLIVAPTSVAPNWVTEFEK